MRIVRISTEISPCSASSSCVPSMHVKHSVSIVCRHVIRSPPSIAFVWIKVNERERRRHLHWTSMCGVYTGGWLRSLSKVLTDISQSTTNRYILEYGFNKYMQEMCFREWNRPIIISDSWSLSWSWSDVFQMMKSADYYIGVDVGTASVRAGLVTSQGKVKKKNK